MREILFRGKRIDNGEWAEGYYGQFHNRPILKMENSHKIFELIEDAFLFGSAIGGLWRTVLADTVGQYTGLTDKNGKKIFEGDICQIKGISHIDETPFIIEWNNEYSGWFWRNLDYSSATDTITPEIANTAHVIGNLHDNPELLNGGAE